MRDDAPRPAMDSWSLLGIGGYALACLAAGMGLGRLVDGWLDTVPALTLAGLAVGTTAAVVGTWLRIKSFFP